MVRQRFAEPLKLNDVAAEAGVHQVHLAREFRRRFHCTVGEYLRRLRIDFASSELAGTEAPIADIALRAGFFDQSHFSKSFKRITGMTPAHYRQTMRSKASR